MQVFDIFERRMDLPPYRRALELTNGADDDSQEISEDPAVILATQDAWARRAAFFLLLSAFQESPKTVNMTAEELCQHAIGFLQGEHRQHFFSIMLEKFWRQHPSVLVHLHPDISQILHYVHVEQSSIVQDILRDCVHMNDDMPIAWRNACALAQDLRVRNRYRDLSFDSFTKNPSTGISAYRRRGEHRPRPGA